MSFTLAEHLKEPLPTLPMDRCGATGKVCYPTKRAAQKALATVNRLNGSVMHSFRCEYGDHYHLGHRR